MTAILHKPDRDAPPCSRLLIECATGERWLVIDGERIQVACDGDGPEWVAYAEAVLIDRLHLDAAFVDLLRDYLVVTKAPVDPSPVLAYYLRVTCY